MIEEGDDDESNEGPYVMRNERKPKLVELS